ncbi:SET domain-containing protein [Sistotremastrum suecicum HHB10207 ss-3]|uniref:SET domain-containing protein n=1 Tax=Sistotremastrum suecicum HHB10207 ss-3 TaxID=1314776 RepID=A0A166HFM6_9AGAM|nr:SET domain-containing protein [Sistotremastrum suecicum HHB10207 ss-3]
MATPKSTPHLNDLGLEIRYLDGKGRGLIATRPISSQTVLEISPVLLFSKDEYEKHGKHTVLDHYTFCWPDRSGRMALALGLGSIFNHSSHPNVTYSIDAEAECIRFTTSRNILEGDELCIFYSHNLWFEDNDVSNESFQNPDTPISNDVASPDSTEDDGISTDLFPDDLLPFESFKYLRDDGEELSNGVVATVDAWVVDIPEPRETTTLLEIHTPNGSWHA